MFGPGVVARSGVGAIKGKTDRKKRKGCMRDGGVREFISFFLHGDPDLYPHLTPWVFLNAGKDDC
jgi:hypothetical protein